MNFFKGQTEVVTAVLIFGVVVSLVGATYIWGVPLIKKQQSIGNIERIESFMKDFADRIEKVDNNQVGARDIYTLKEDGVFSVNTKDNSVEFITHQSGSKYTITTDPASPNWNPVAWGPELSGIYGLDKPAIIRAKSVTSGDGYDITYQVKFRDLITKENQNRYLINVTTDSTRGQDKGVNGDEVHIENKGRVQVSDSYTQSIIKITIPK